MPVSIEDIAKQMLALLPDDGTPVLNRVMRSLLSRHFETEVSQDQFFEARARLLNQRQAGRLRGQGGQVFLVREDAAASANGDQTTFPEPWPEIKLMIPLQKYLEGPFREGLEIPASGACVIQDTSTIGKAGKWARPDFILVAARKFKFSPAPQIDVHSFELKTVLGVDDYTVYQVLAQTRFTHFGHLVWHVPDDASAEARLPKVEKQCEFHGLGLIRMREPQDLDSYEILVDPERKQTLPATVDDFLELRLDEMQQSKILGAINS